MDLGHIVYEQPESDRQPNCFILLRHRLVHYLLVLVGVRIGYGLVEPILQGWDGFCDIMIIELKLWEFVDTTVRIQEGFINRLPRLLIAPHVGILDVVCPCRALNEKMIVLFGSGLWICLFEVIQYRFYLLELYRVNRLQQVLCYPCRQ